MGAIKLLPLIGNPLAYLIEHWGIRETVFGVAGWLAGWILIYFGQAPGFLLSRNPEAPPSPASVQAPPPGVDLVPLENVPDWLQPYSHWLEGEADSLVNRQRIAEYRLCELHAAGLTPSASFRWRLKTVPGLEMSGWAFRRTQERLFQHLKPEKVDAGTLRFDVPALEQGDELLTVLTVRGRQPIGTEECQDLVRSVVE